MTAEKLKLCDSDAEVLLQDAAEANGRQRVEAKTRQRKVLPNIFSVQRKDHHAGCKNALFGGCIARTGIRILFDKEMAQRREVIRRNTDCINV